MAEGIRVLYVDDEIDLLDLGKIYLEESGDFSVDTVTSAAEALDILNRNQYDAIVADYQMPKMDGIEFLKRVRAANKTIPFVLFTGRGREEVVIDALNNGADFYVQKGGDAPSQFMELGHKIRQTVQMRQTERSLAENRDYLDRIFSSVQSGIVVIDTKTHEILDLNPAAAGMIGTTKDQIAGKKCQCFICPAEQGKCPVTDLHQTVDNTERVLLTADGKKLDIIKHVVPFRLHSRECLLETFHDNTERKQAADQLRHAIAKVTVAEEELRQNFDMLIAKEQALRESEEKFRSLVETSPGIIWEIDLQGRFRYVSPVVTPLTGYTPEELVGKRLTDIVPEQQGVILKRELERTISSGGNLPPFDVPVIHRNGQDLLLEIHPSGVTDANGMLIGLRGVATDVTGRKLAEAALRESEQKFTTTFRSTPVSLTLVSATDGVFVDVNDAFSRNTGYGRDEVIGTTSEKLGIFPDRDEYAQLVSRLRKDGHVSGMELQCRGKTGVISTCRFSSSIVTMGGKPHILSTVEDITGRKQSEVALRESEELFRIVFNNANDAMTLVENRPEGPGRYLLVNDRTLQLLGYTRDELLEKSPRDLIPPEVMEKIQPDTVRRITRDGEAIFESVNRRKDGSTVQVEVSVRQFPYRGRNVSLGIIRDITDRKIAESALQTIVKSMVGTTGLDSLKNITENISAWLKADCVMIGEIQPDRETVRVLSMLLDGKEVRGFSYTLKGTPCENAAEKGFCLYPDNARQLFSDAKDIADLNIRGYVGTSLRNSNGRVNGILCALSRSPMKSVPAMREIMDVIATKAAAEIERARIEQSLHNNRQLLADAMDLAHLASWEYDVVSGIITFDHRFSALYGITAEPGGENRMMATTYSSEFVYPEDRGIVDEEVVKALATTDPRYVSQQVHRAIRRNGEILYIDAHIGITKDAEGRTIKIHGVNQDITGRRQAEDALRQANKKLNLLSGITRHDISNQLLALNGFAGIIKKKIHDPVLDDYLSRITKASSQIAAMIRFTKEYEQVGVHLPVWQDLNTLANEAEKSATLGTIALHNNLPAGTEVYADPLIARVFYNLIDNAVRHGGGTIATIRFALETRNGDRIVVCEDDGDGVPAGIKEQIFDRGFGKNTGFGLFISREILDITGISIIETGEPGTGARFEIAIPKGAWRYSEEREG